MTNAISAITQRLKNEPPRQRRFAFCLAISWLLHILLMMPGHGGSIQKSSASSIRVKLISSKQAVVTKNTLPHPDLAPNPNRELPVLATSTQRAIQLPAMTETTQNAIPQEIVASDTQWIEPTAEAVASLDGQSTPAPETLVPWEALAAPYYRSIDVDIKAEPIGELKFDYPIEPASQHQMGTILVEVLIDEKGFVVASHILETTLPESYSQLAQERLQQTPYAPAIKNGMPVKNRKTLILQYDPKYGFN